MKDTFFGIVCSLVFFLVALGWIIWFGQHPEITGYSDRFTIEEAKVYQLKRIADSLEQRK